MQQLPLPTDNLYKFMALAGLALFLFGIIYPVRLIGEIRLNIVDIQVEIEIAQHITKDIDLKLYALEHDPEATLDDTFALKTEFAKLQERAAKLNGSHQKNSILVSQLWLFIGLAFVTTFGGFALSYRGFKLWYYRVQLPSDLRIAKDDT